MAGKTKTAETLASNLISKAKDAEYFRDVYTNHIQVTITANEMFLDLYMFYPSTHGREPTATRVGRILVPLNLVKGLQAALENTVTAFEKETNIVIYNLHDGLPEKKEEQV